MDRYQMFDALKKYKEKQKDTKELNSMDSFMHAGTSYNHYQSNQPGYYAKLEDFWGKGKHRYFYTKAEWDAYNKNKQAAQNAGADRAAKEKENAAKKTPVQQAQSGREAAIKQAQENEKKRKEEEALKAARQAEAERKNRQAEVNKEAEQIKAEREVKRKAYIENFQKNAKKTEEERKNRQAEVNAEAEKIKAEKEEALKNKDYIKWYKEKNAAEIEKNSEQMKNDSNSILNVMTDIIDYTVPETTDEFNQLVSDYSAGIFQMKIAENDEKIKDVYEWIEANKETEEIDPKTGFRIKNYELSTEEEMKIVNPGYYYSDQQMVDELLYGIGVGPNEYANNCYACTQAMALRKKGYDVTPGSDVDGIMASGTDPEIGTSYDNLWTGKFTDYDDYKDTYRNISKEPVGSYGDFNWSYFDGTQWCGHSIFYEVKADGVHYYDCQNGFEYDESTIKKLNDSTLNFTSRYKRLDNQEFKASQKMKDSGKISKKTMKTKGGSDNEK